jgi:transposase-like protein
LIHDVLPNCPICGSTNGYEVSGIFGKYAKCFKCSYQGLSMFRESLPVLADGLIRQKATEKVGKVWALTTFLREA